MDDKTKELNLNMARSKKTSVLPNKPALVESLEHYLVNILNDVRLKSHQLTDEASKSSRKDKSPDGAQFDGKRSQDNYNSQSTSSIVTSTAASADFDVTLYSKMEPMTLFVHRFVLIFYIFMRYSFY